MTTYRILLHNHSVWSDGQMSLQTVAKWGLRFGADAVVMSEHDYHFTQTKWDDYKEACREASTNKCKIIPGIEYSSPADQIHIPTVGVDRFYGARRDIVELLSDIKAGGGAAVLAHPTRKNALAYLSADAENLLDGIEIWNRKVDGVLPVRSHYQLARTRNLATTIGMDLHTYRQVFPMWNEIETTSASLDGQSIADAIRARRITPACIFGKIAPGLGDRPSAAIRLLSATERLRRLARDFRDNLQLS